MAKTILFVDDDNELRDLLASFFQAKGYRILTCADGWDAAREIVSSRPDLVVMDVNMPKMSGLGALDLLRESRKKHPVPILIASSQGDKETIMKALSLGADDFLVKPYSFEKLSARIEEQFYELDEATLLNLVKKPVNTNYTEEPIPFSVLHNKSPHYIEWDEKRYCVLLAPKISMTEVAQWEDDRIKRNLVVYFRQRMNWKKVWPSN